jgi:tetratricopeptide (TPR) repeat protein
MEPEVAAAAAPKLDSAPSVPMARSWIDWKAWLAALVIVLAGLLAYSNSFHGAFALDDLPAIKENLTVQKTWADALHPPKEGQTVTGRPLVNLSFAANYQWDVAHKGDGFGVTGYHVVNLAIHLLAGLALFGLVRRTLELPKLREQFAEAAVPVALAAALLWTLHPLQTESVTYLAQRAESLMGLFYLTTFYCFARGVQSSRAGAWVWHTLAVLACFLGVLSKEVTITAPVLILLYDFIFVADSPREIIRRRGLVYALLGLAMVTQVGLALSVGTRGYSAGYGAGLGWMEYAFSQFPAIVRYLALTVWPHPLVLDYGDRPETSWLVILPAMALVLAMLAGTGWLLWRRPRLGFMGAWFFVILAPSSSVIPIVTENVAEHRVYLPLAAAAVLTALGLWAWLGRRAVWVAGALAFGLGLITLARNADYASGLDLWRDTVAKHPTIARAHENYGIMLADNNRLRESVQEYETALSIRPIYPDCENNLGNALGLLGENEQAALHYAHAIEGLLRDSDRAVAYYNLGNAQREIAMKAADPVHDAHMQEALNDYQRATQLRPQYASAYHNIGTVLSQAGRYEDAIHYYLQALNAQPVFPQAEINLANTFVLAGNPHEAIEHYQIAIQEDGGNALPYYRLGLTLMGAGETEEAVREFTAAAQLAPNAPEAHESLGEALAKLGRYDDAAQELQQALALKPDYVEARTMLDNVMRQSAHPPPTPAP